MKVLITGGTGAIGQQVVGDLRARLPRAELIVLSRQAGTTAGCAHLVCDLSSDEIRGDTALAETLARVDYVVHMAADVRFSQTIDEAIRNNTESTRRILDAATEYCRKLRRFIFLSTAFVSCPDGGIRTDASLEIGGHVFNNSYEASKWKAETIVREGQIPWTIVRPSLVIGHSRSGHISRFNGLYRIIRLAAQGMVPIMVGDPAGYIDIVPVDVVSDAVLEAIFSSEDKRTIWAGSGSAAPRLLQVLSVLIESVNAARKSIGFGRIEQPPILPYETYDRVYRPRLAEILSQHERMVLRSIEFFIPYLSVPKPITTVAADRWFQSPAHPDYLAKSLSYWCGRNRGIIARKEHPEPWLTLRAPIAQF